MIPQSPGGASTSVYNYGYLDEGSKRSLRRAILKAVAIPGFQVPIASQEMPLPAGWGTGGMQLTASLIGRHDVLKVIDQGADDSTNAISLRKFFARVAEVETTTSTRSATIIQTRHRLPENPLLANQIVVVQVPIPEPLRQFETAETAAEKHASSNYGGLFVALYEAEVRGKGGAPANNHPVLVHGRYIAAPSPMPKFDNLKLDQSPALFLFGAGRHRRIYAIPPFTKVDSVAFKDRPFTPTRLPGCCELCGATDSYLDRIASDQAEYVLACSDTSYCLERRNAREDAL